MSKVFWSLAQSPDSWETGEPLNKSRVGFVTEWGVDLCGYIDLPRPVLLAFLTADADSWGNGKIVDDCRALHLADFRASLFA